MDDIRIDNDLFKKLKLIKIEEFKKKYSTIKFKYKKISFSFYVFIKEYFHILLFLDFFFSIFKS
jgi:hypothetical protein